MLVHILLVDVGLLHLLDSVLYVQAVVLLTNWRLRGEWMLRFFPQMAFNGVNRGQRGYAWGRTHLLDLVV